MAIEVCSTPMCDAGKASVDEMTHVYESYASRLDGFTQRFSGPVYAIQQAFNDNWSWYSDMIPFNPNCCTIRDLGVQADDLTRQMLEYAHAAAMIPGSASQAPPLELPDPGFLLAVAVGVMALVFVWPYLQRR